METGGERRERQLRRWVKVQVRLSLVPCVHKLEFNPVGIREKSDWQHSETAAEGKTKDRNHSLSGGMQPRELLRHKSTSALSRTNILQCIAPP